jgi:hypothetical protein
MRQYSDVRLPRQVEVAGQACARNTFATMSLCPRLCGSYLRMYGTEEVRRAGKGQRIASSGVHTPAPLCGKQRLSSSLLGGRLQAFENFHHRWRQIRVMMRHLPRSSFSLINVRHPNLARDFLSA